MGNLQSLITFSLLCSLKLHKPLKQIIFCTSMKIAFVNDTFLEGRGADTVIYELARILGKTHEVFVITCKADIPEENFKILKVNGKKLLSGNTLGDVINYFPNLLKIRKEIIRLNKIYNFDIFSVHHSSLNPLFLGLPAIVTWHGSPVSKNFLRVYLNKTMLKTLKRNPYSFVVSEYMKEELSKKIPKNKIKVVYNGVSNEFKPTNKDEGFMFFVGRLDEHKSVHELIRISKETTFPLKIAGSGPLEDKLKTYKERIKANNVEFLGRISRKDLIKNYQECSFFISASKWEGFGLIFLEAAACSKPSIGYAKGSVPEVVLDEKTGFLAQNYGDLKNKVDKLIKDKRLREHMGKEALEYSKKFTWNESVKDYENVFRLVSSA